MPKLTLTATQTAYLTDNNLKSFVGSYYLPGVDGTTAHHAVSKIGGIDGWCLVHHYCDDRGRIPRNASKVVEEGCTLIAALTALVATRS